MTNMTARSKIKSMELRGVITRCGCPDWKKKLFMFLHIFHAQRNKVCPNPRQIEDLGIIASYNAEDLDK